MKPWLKYLITFGVGAVMAFLSAWALGLFSAEGATDVMKALSDGCAIAGVLLFGVGLLVFASNAGMFSMISYGAISFVNAFRRDVSKRKYKTYYDYTEAKKEKKKKFSHLLLTGLAFIALAVFFLILYYSI